MNAYAKEAAFQLDIINQRLELHGVYQLGTPSKYDRGLALYTEDCLSYVKSTQPRMWEKYRGLYRADSEKAFIDKLSKV
jgi:type I restriction enzyme R subunit